MIKTVIPIFVLTVVVVGLAMTVPALLTSDAMRTEMAKRISDASGMETAFNGPVNLSVFPDLGLVAQQVVLKAPDGSMDVSAGKIIAGVKMMPLLAGSVEITEISLDQPEITLIETGAVADGSSPNTGSDNDPLKAIVSLLENVSLSGLSISEGKLSSQTLSGELNEFTNINASLDASNLDEQVAVSLSAVQNGRSLTLNASVAALRPILQQQPAPVEIAVQISPAPHPALANIKANGTVQLGNDGSYYLTDGRFFLLDQEVRLDALYRPGERPAAAVKLSAGEVDLGLFTQSTVDPSSGAGAESNASASTAAVDLSGLTGIDLNLDVAINSLLMNGVRFTDIRLLGGLDKGLLNVEVDHANNNIGVTISSDLNQKIPTFTGSLQSKSLQLAAVRRIANIDAPLDGSLSLNLGYAFRGTNQKSIRNSLNIAGTVGLSKAALTLPQLRNAGLGASAEQISDLSFNTEIKDIRQPISVEGDLTWKTERIAFAGSVLPLDFLNGNGGAVRLSINSNRLDASYAGSVNLNGNVRGNARVNTASLGGLLAWLGQSGDANLKDFSYAGDIAVSDKNIAFSNGDIVFNGIKASGNGEVSLTGKTSINTNLAFGTLDLKELLAGGSSGANGNAASAGRGDTTPIDLSPLRSLNADINISASKLAYGKVHTGPTRTSLVIKDGIARLQLPQTPFYEGTVLADIVADGSGDVPSIKLASKLSNIAALPLFRDAADFRRIEGTLNAEINTFGSGKTTDQLTRSLNGNAVARFADGAIIGVDIAKIYNSVSAVLSGEYKQNASDKTRFTEMGLSFKIDKGVATTDDIKLLGPLVRMDGAGTVDLAGQTINMRLNPLVVGTATGQGGEFDVAGVGIPLIVEGPLAKPKVYPDLTSILQNPTAALQTLSKLGLGIKGLKNVDLNLEKLAKGLGGDGKLKLDNLDLGDTANQAKKTVEPLLGNNPSGAGDLVGSLLGNIVRSPGANQSEANTNSAVAGGSQSTGRIPIPTPNPRRSQPAQRGVSVETLATNPAVKNAVEDVLEKNIPIDEKALSDGLNGLFKRVLP